MTEHTLDESGLVCSCHARFSTRWEASEHVGVSTGGPLATLSPSIEEGEVERFGAIDSAELADRSMVACLEAEGTTLTSDFRRRVAVRFGELMDVRRAALTPQHKDEVDV
jgi:hypothetical protein